MQAASRGTERQYGLDWLRIGAFGLQILYHIGMFFVPWGWLGLIPLALIVGLLAAVIWQRINNKEDDYYDRNVDK